MKRNKKIKILVFTVYLLLSLILPVATLYADEDDTTVKSAEENELISDSDEQSEMDSVSDDELEEGQREEEVERERQVGINAAKISGLRDVTRNRKYSSKKKIHLRLPNTWRWQVLTKAGTNVTKSVAVKAPRGMSISKKSSELLVEATRPCKGIIRISHTNTVSGETDTMQISVKVTKKKSKTSEIAGKAGVVRKKLKRLMPRVKDSKKWVSESESGSYGGSMLTKQKSAVVCIKTTNIDRKAKITVSTSNAEQLKVVNYFTRYSGTTGYTFVKLRAGRISGLAVITLTAKEYGDKTEFVKGFFIPSRVVLPVTNIMQNPELPNGCEITSLTIVLNYLGFPADKMTMARQYLAKGAVGTVTPNEAFLGDPASRSGYGCYAPVIKRSADKYLSDVGSNKRGQNITGTNFRDLFSYIEDGNPVIIWATINMAPSRPSTVWYIHGKKVTWIYPLHCLVLQGYDADRNLVYIADPLIGNTTYRLDLVERRYNELEKQAVIIQ